MHDEVVTTVRFRPTHPHEVITGGERSGLFAWDLRAPIKYARY